MKSSIIKIKHTIDALVQTNSAKGALFFVLLGALTSLAFAPVGFYPFIFISLPILVWALDSSQNKKRTFFTGFCFAFGVFAAGLYWVANSFTAQTDVPQWLGFFAVLGLASVLSIFVGFAFVLAKCFWSKSPKRILVFAICWALFEWLRGNMFTGLPWLQLAQVWEGNIYIMQSLSVVGSYGLGFLTVFVAASTALFFDQLGTGRRYILIPALLISLITVGYGYARLDGAEINYYPDVRLRLVQANISQLEKWQPSLLSRNLNKHIELSKDSASSERPPTHIIWPETAVPYYLHSRPDVREGIMQALAGNAQLITGVPRIERLAQTKDGAPPNVRVYNSIIALTPNAEISMSYDKHHLVPFGEYVPLSGLLEAIGMRQLVAGGVGFSSGNGVQTANIAGLPAFSPLICYEIIFPSSVREGGASWILNLTNDAWFGESFGPYQHFSQARFRAVEEGVSVVRVAGSGISAVIDPFGRVLASLALGQQGYLDVNLPKPLLSSTIYYKHGDLLFLLMLLLSSGLLLTQPKRE